MFIQGGHILECTPALEIVSILGKNSVDPDEMLHYSAFHLGLHRFPKYPFRGFKYAKGKMIQHMRYLVLNAYASSEDSGKIVQTLVFTASTHKE